MVQPIRANEMYRFEAALFSLILSVLCFIVFPGFHSPEHQPNGRPIFKFFLRSVGLLHVVSTQRGTVETVFLRSVGPWKRFFYAAWDRGNGFSTQRGTRKLGFVQVRKVVSTQRGTVEAPRNDTKRGRYPQVRCRRWLHKRKAVSSPRGRS
jgi:hypothetical protein